MSLNFLISGSLADLSNLCVVSETNYPGDFYVN